MRPALIPLLALLVSLGSCNAWDEQRCPTSLERLRSEKFTSNLGTDHVSGTAVVNRFVEAPDPQYRGYDIEIRTRAFGFRDDEQFMFVQTRDRLAGIEPGTEVILFGARGEQPAGIIGAGCSVLQPIPPRSGG